MSERLYILYDSRACGGDTEEASVLVCCEDDREARSYRGEFGGMACFSYEHGPNKMLIDERFEWNWFPDPQRRTRRQGIVDDAPRPPSPPHAHEQIDE